MTSLWTSRALFTRADTGEQYTLSYHCARMQVPILQTFNSLQSGYFSRAFNFPFIPVCLPYIFLVCSFSSCPLITVLLLFYLLLCSFYFYFTLSLFLISLYYPFIILVIFICLFLYIPFVFILFCCYFTFIFNYF